jgi:Icc-related predicted phosphoesterase
LLPTARTITTGGVNLLSVSDLHYKLPQFDWLLDAAPHYDAILIAGDLLDLASLVDPDVQILVVSRYLESLSAMTCVAVCSGNHDGDVRVDDGFSAQWLTDLRRPGLHVDSETFEMPGLRISVCPWWEGPTARNAMADWLREESSHRSSTPWMWLHHAPPDQSPVSWTGRVFAGDPFLGELIDELSPTWVMSGHIHHAPMVSGGSWHATRGKTLVFNAGAQVGPVPASIRMDLQAGRATFVSYDEAESIHLALPGQ